ncbi:MAG: hydrolase [Gemmatimonadetes bacterium]|nr:hydrolase [Gemmatimonadota bacterium]
MNIPRAMRVTAIALAVGVVSRSVPAQGGEPPPPVGAAHTVKVGPVIDGHLDDAVWKEATPFTGFVQREPTLGAPVTERTEVRVLVDGEALYIGAWLYDRDPSGIVPGEKIRDGQLANSDYFGVILDTYHDRQNGFVFATTPAGIEYDGQVTREGEGGGVYQTGQTSAQAGAMGGFNLNWDGSWTVATSTDSLGWYAEFRIPFSTLRYGAGDIQNWGLNLVRVIRRRNEESYWAPIPRQFSLYRLSLAGSLTDLKVPAHRVASITPYVIGSSSRDYVAGTGAVTHRDFGADAKLGITPSLTLDLTYNTDFAQVEVDDQRVNLTRFPLFFPEKRPFFLENAGIFSAGTPQGVELFFSRRIGIDSLGNPQRILGGGRLSGRIGETTVGLMQINTDDPTTGKGGQSFSVARVIREFGQRSRIGVMAVQRVGSDSAGDYNRTYAVDGRLGISEALTVDWWGAKTDTPHRTGDDLGYSARAAYQTDDWNNSFRLVKVGVDFNPEVGFLNREGGYTYYEAILMRYIRFPELKWLRDFNPHISYRGYYQPGGSYESGWLHIDLVKADLTNGGRIGPEWDIYHERLTAPFAIANNVTLPVGSYDFAGPAADFNTDPSLPLSFTLHGDFGQFYNGMRSGGTANVTFRRGASLSSSLLVDYTDVTLQQGHFIRSLVGARNAWFFTPRIFVQSLTQFNNQTNSWSANVRFGWLATAGTGLYVVFNDGEEADSFFSWVRPQNRSLTIKYTRQIGTGN